SSHSSNSDESGVGIATAFAAPLPTAILSAIIASLFIFFGVPPARGPRLALGRRRAKRCPGEAMATRNKKGSGTEGELPKRRTSGKTTSAPRKRVRKVQEEAQIVGADVVPSVSITTEETPATLLSDWDYHLFNEGSHHRLWDKLGSHPIERDGLVGTMFAVWAPNARSVSVVGDWNGWSPQSNPLESRGASGIWERFIPGVHKGMKYKYHIVSQHAGYEVEKADPVGIHHETPPRTASIVWDLDYEWSDAEWMRSRAARN